MAKVILLLDKDDIKTSIIGNNLEIRTQLLDINLTQDAVRELVNDFSAIIKMIDDEGIEYARIKLKNGQKEN